MAVPPPQTQLPAGRGTPLPAPYPLGASILRPYRHFFLSTSSPDHGTSVEMETARWTAAVRGLDAQSVATAQNIRSAKKKAKDRIRVEHNSIAI